jgi:hypothetical protein
MGLGFNSAWFFAAAIGLGVAAMPSRHLRSGEIYALAGLMCAALGVLSSLSWPLTPTGGYVVVQTMTVVFFAVFAIHVTYAKARKNNPPLPQFELEIHQIMQKDIPSTLPNLYQRKIGIAMTIHNHGAASATRDWHVRLKQPWDSIGSYPEITLSGENVEDNRLPNLRNDEAVVPEKGRKSGWIVLEIWSPYPFPRHPSGGIEYIVVSCADYTGRRHKSPIIKEGHYPKHWISYSS